MPRKYVKTAGSKACFKYAQEDLSAAVASVESGKISIREATRGYSVPYGTVYNRIHRLGTGKHGGQTVLKDNEERDLCEVIQVAGEWGFPLTKSDIRFLVQSYLDTNKRETRFKKNLPGYDWICLFLLRNKSTLSARLSENIKRSRAKVNPEIINEYFDKLAITLQNVPPANIINFDETNFTDDPESKTVVVRKGQRHAENILDHSKSSFSVMFAGAANGAVLPPYIVYAALHLYPTWTEGGPKGARYNRTKSGWFDTMVFEDWFHTIAFPYFKSLKNDDPKVIIGDNVASHLSFKVFKSCLDNNIRFAFLPPNATHICQPLDVAFFRPLKKSWRQTLEDWKKRSRGSVPKHRFPGLLKAAIDDIQKNSAQNMRSGFRTTEFTSQ
ncbi:uncharacterized protein LOC134209364 [Armigeres subalbatus]|uniref:uncharacterized protein LOC134209364 n=1 Tax=Armigeres subalbatus TaxID=124917 RepID=UPI002ED4A3BE